MKLMGKFVLGAAMAASMVFSASAQSSQVGQVGSVSGDVGQVIVQRGGKTYSLSAGDALFAGDRIEVKPGGSINVSAYGCDRAYGAREAFTLAANFCAPTTVAEATGPNTPPPSAGPGLGIAAAAAGVGVVAALASGSDDDSPSSP